MVRKNYRAAAMMVALQYVLWPQACLADGMDTVNSTTPGKLANKPGIEEAKGTVNDRSGVKSARSEREQPDKDSRVGVDEGVLGPSTGTSKGNGQQDTAKAPPSQGTKSNNGGDKICLSPGADRVLKPSAQNPSAENQNAPTLRIDYGVLRITAGIFGIVVVPAAVFVIAFLCYRRCKRGREKSEVSMPLSDRKAKSSREAIESAFYVGIMMTLAIPVVGLLVRNAFFAEVSAGGTVEGAALQRLISAFFAMFALLGGLSLWSRYQEQKEREEMRKKHEEMKKELEDRLEKESKELQGSLDDKARERERVAGEDLRHLIRLTIAEELDAYRERRDPR